MLHVLFTSTIHHHGTIFISRPESSSRINPVYDVIYIPPNTRHQKWLEHLTPIGVRWVPAIKSDRVKYYLTRSGLQVLVVLLECVNNSQIVTRKVVTYVPYHTLSLSGFLAAGSCHTKKSSTSSKESPHVVGVWYKMLNSSHLIDE